MLRLIGLLVVVAVAAYFTKPDEAKMAAAANAKAAEVTEAAAENVDIGGAIGGLVTQASGGVYENFYVVARYSAPNLDSPLVQCWGAFTQTLCNKVGSPE
ncbi:MAG: hypothetical protein WDM79_14725 [Terricaulis sp.]